MPSLNFKRFLDSRIDATLAEIEQERRAKTERAIVENSQRAFGGQGNRTGASGSYHGSGSVQGSSAGGSRAGVGSSYTQGIGTYDNYLCKIEIRNNYLHIVKAHRYYGNLDKLVQDIDRDKKLLERAFSENSSLSPETINIPANALTGFERIGGGGRQFSEFHFTRKDFDTRQRAHHYICVLSREFAGAIEDFANTHFHY